MAKKAGKQLIKCNVASCAYWANDHLCELGSIEVDACPGQSSGNAADESMCASYCKKGN